MVPSFYESVFKDETLKNDLNHKKKKMEETEEEALDKGKKEIFSCNDFPIIVALSL